MRLVPISVDVSGTVRAAVSTDGSGRAALGPLLVTLAADPGGDRIEWTIANTGDRAVAVRAVALVFRVEGMRPPLRMLRHGWQSWSACGVATFGVDRDPSHAGAALPPFVRGIFHADQDVVPSVEELRSEWVTVLADGDGESLLLGFAAGTAHDGTLRLRRDADDEVVLRAEAFLGGARLGPGTERVLHALVLDERTGIDAGTKLRAWATAAGRTGGARVSAPYQVGWCSWYHYFHDVSEAVLRRNLARAADWPFDVFQLDDGFQSAIGDWLATNDRFPAGLPAIAETIAANGRRPGLWIAPFLVAPDADLAQRHPEWLARDSAGAPLVGMWNPPWGGDGRMWVLDTTQPAVQAHLESVAHQLATMGFGYLKLDFTFAPALDGVWADAHRTPAERVREGLAAIRRGAGDQSFLLGCGVPLAPSVGLVDANRIGPDVAPSWQRPADAVPLPGYEDTQPATLNAWRNALARAFMHRALWANDPDCLMLRTAHTALSADAAATWAHAVALSGGLALVSDDLALLGAAARRQLDDALALGRASDALAVVGEPARCDDLLTNDPPTRLAAAGWTIEANTTTGTSVLTNRRR